MSCFYNKVSIKGERDLSTDGLAPVDAAADRRPDALSQSIYSEEKQKVRLAIAKLPRRLAEIITLRELEECDYEEISRRLNIPRGTVMSRLYRARLKLARILKKSGIASGS
jgi:RNA polymerase sigma-70 factor (ECF subfamily)